MQQIFRRFIHVTASLLAATTVMLGLAGPAEAEPGWDPTLPATISAGAPGDPLAIANASLQATAQATQTTMDLGRKFLSGLGINIGDDSAGNVAPGQRVHGKQAIEYVIRRAGSQMGCPTRGAADR